MTDVRAADDAASPVDDAALTGPLVKALRGHVDALAATIDAPDDQRRRVAVAWAYSTALVAWAETHELIHPWLRLAHQYVPNQQLAMAQWLAHAVQSLAAHPSSACLARREWNPMWLATPSEGPLRALVSWWTEGDRVGHMAHASSGGPGSVSGWLVGDLLQALSDERRLRHALVQTPWWVVDLILDRTLIRAADEFRDKAVSAIDPCCGTGHFLIRMIDYLWELYTTGSLAPRQAKAGGVDGWAPVSPATAIEWIVNGVTGVELDPLTAAVARLRCLVAIGDLMSRSGLLAGPVTIDRMPHWVRPRVAVGDSLLSGDTDRAEYARLHPAVAAVYGWTAATGHRVVVPRRAMEQLCLFDEVA